MKAKIIWKKIKCFFGIHQYRRMYFRRTKWSKLFNNYTLEIECFECKNCQKTKSKSYEI